MQEKEEKRSFSVAELAGLLGISRIAVFRKIKKGKIPAKQVGRAYVIEREDVEHLLPCHPKMVLSDEEKKDIRSAVEKVVEDYGETLRQLGKE